MKEQYDLTLKESIGSVPTLRAIDGVRCIGLPIRRDSGHRYAKFQTGLSS
jgi:hypothetical protein